jgi:mono/diheme cytochrome c family protein
MVLASAQQAVAVGIVGVLVIGWLAYIVLTNARRQEPRGSEIELAPNRRPYLDDDAMEGPRLDRALMWGLLSLAFVGIGLPVYWLGEPGRHEGALNGFDKRAAHRGEELFASVSAKPHPGFGCADCHGADGQGGVWDFTINSDDPDKIRRVKWDVPPLNTVLLRFSQEEVREIITYGRKGTPMPPWGVQGGGAMNEQQVGNLVAFLKTIQLTPEEAHKDSVRRAEAEAKASGKTSVDGEVLFNTFCARCHTKGWSYRRSYMEPDAVPGGGAFGPNLTEGDEVRQFPDAADQIEFITAGSLFQEQYGVRGVGTGRMPGFGKMLTRAQIEAIVEYERSL